MSKVYVLYNTAAGRDTTLEVIKVLEKSLGDAEFIEVNAITDHNVFFAGLEADDKLVLCGGDGTLNRFVNDTEGIDIKCDILYYACGSGNDFAHDLGHTMGDAPFKINEYIKDLPIVEVGGKKYRFINGVGYGIDGYCCEVGDELKRTSLKPVNYTSIAIKGLLFHYKPTNAKITVDGKEHSFKKVWLAPTMTGRFYGGGMMPTPAQDRLDRDKLSTLVFHGTGKLRTLIIFPSLFKGEHIKHTKVAEVLTGSVITVEFDRPTALQIDGETILGVTSYTAYSKALSNQKEKEEAATV